MLSDDLRQRLREFGQDHLIGIIERAEQPVRAKLVADLQAINLAEIHALFQQRERKDALPDRSRIQPIPVPTMTDADRIHFRDVGIQAMKAGEVAFLVVAGGQGTRLGFDEPKGMFPIGPVSKKSLFQIHAEKVQALRSRYAVRLPLIVMTSPATDAATRQYFKRKNYFRLPPQDVLFFCQGTMPAVDLATGRLLRESHDQLCLSPNGHGGTITGLDSAGILEKLRGRGIRTISYFQVDNPLVNLADFVFLGRHLREEAEVSSKALPKAGPKEKVGNFLLVDNRCAMIEYSDLPDEWALESDDAGNLKFWAGNPAIHLFDVGFLGEIAGDAERLPWHLARKKVPHLDDADTPIKPESENALKFERFIFDALPQAERWTILATNREDEFAPVKNKDGVDSPDSARALMIGQARRWLEEAGVSVAEGVGVEISPLFALDVEEIRKKWRGGSEIRKSTYIS